MADEVVVGRPHLPLLIGVVVECAAFVVVGILAVVISGDGRAVALGTVLLLTGALIFIATMLPSTVTVSAGRVERRWMGMTWTVDLDRVSSVRTMEKGRGIDLRSEDDVIFKLRLGHLGPEKLKHLFLTIISEREEWVVDDGAKWVGTPSAEE